jgi:hypothetical protein
MRTGQTQQPTQPAQNQSPVLSNGMNDQQVDAYTQSQYGKYGRTATPEDLGIWRNYYNSPQYASGQGSGYWNSQLNSLLGEYQKYGNHDRSAAALAAYNSGQGQNNGGIGPSTGVPGNTGVMGPTNTGTGMNIPPELMTAFQQFLASYNKPQAAPPPERTRTLREVQNQNPNRSSTQYRRGTR